MCIHTQFLCALYLFVKTKTELCCGNARSLRIRRAQLANNRQRLGPKSITTLTLEIRKLLYRTIDMGACLSFEHIAQQLPELVRESRDIIWVIKRTKDALVRYNCIEKDSLCPKGVFVPSPVRCYGPKSGDV
jgi:hypothetical protein